MDTISTTWKPNIVERIINEVDEAISTIKNPLLQNVVRYATGVGAMWIVMYGGWKATLVLTVFARDYLGIGVL